MALPSARHQLLDLLRTRAYLRGEFTLASGAKSDHYFDAKMVTYDADGARLVGEVVLEILGEYNVDAVGGLTMGADPIATAVAITSSRTDRKIPAFVVRKDGPKAYGRQKHAEGPLPQGGRVAVVEDVITSGGSALKAVQSVRAGGCEVAVVVALVDREQGGRQAIEAAGIPFRAVFTKSEIAG